MKEGLESTFLNGCCESSEVKKGDLVFLRSSLSYDHASEREKQSRINKIIERRMGPQPYSIKGIYASHSGHVKIELKVENGATIKKSKDYFTKDPVSVI